MEATSKRPLPPLPADLSPECSSSAPTSDPVSPVKSIFEGASKYEILNYLEDARERGLTDCDLELDSEQETAVVEVPPHHRVSVSSAGGSSGSSEPEQQQHRVCTSVEVERNDSGLGSETSRGRPVTKLLARKRAGELEQELVCLDCDQALDTAT